MALISGLSVATGGLANIDRQLALLAHNVSNANTDGYVREIAVQTALTADGRGMGVASKPAMRDVDATLLAALQSQNSLTADAETRQTALAALDGVHGAPGAGEDLASRLGAMRDAFSTLSANPANQTSQQAVVSAAQTLSVTVNTLATSYVTQRQLAYDSMRDDIASLNTALARVGSLSDQIIRLKSLGTSTADLESQRDGAVQQIAALVDVKTLAQPNGDMLLVTPNGMTLPTRGAPEPFSLAGANLQPGAWYPGGGVPGIMLGGADATAQFKTGRIAANIALRDTVLPTYQAALDEFAQTLTQRFDAQGLTLFTDPAGNIPSTGGVPVQSGYVGYSLTIQVNAAVTVNAALVRDGTQAVAGSLTGASAFTPNPSSGPAGFATMIRRILDYALGAEAQDGVAQTPANSTGLGPDGNLDLSIAPPSTLADFAVSLVATQSADSANAATRLKSEQATQSAIKARYDERTGVNVDTEMALMVQLQNAYAANARVIATVQAMWDQLLGAVR